METKDLEKTVNAHLKDIENRLVQIERYSKKRKSWANLHKSVTRNVQQTDEAVLKEMTAYLGESCLKYLIRDLAENIVNDLDDIISSKSSDLKIKIGLREMYF